jgi:uncharacterized OB-fold protein
VADVELDPQGSVSAFSVVRRAADGYKGPVPYAIGTVLLSDGVTVLAHLVERDPAQWRIGDRVELKPCAWHEEVLAFAPRADRRESHA